MMSRIRECRDAQFLRRSFVVYVYHKNLATVVSVNLADTVIARRDSGDVVVRELDVSDIDPSPDAVIESIANLF